MSTLRISNIEAKSVPASATIDEKVKITNSSGDVLVFLDGKTSGITTVGINTTDANITFDANSNVLVTGIITATKFVGTIEPTNLTVGGDLTIPDKIIHTGDTNTAIRFPTNDKISFETAGSERLHIDSSGNIGIGPVSADRMLHLRGTGNAIVKMEADYSGSVTGIEGVLIASGANRYVTGVYGKVVNTSGTESNVASIRLWNQQASPTTSDSPGYITFNTTDDGASTPTEKVRIDSNGSLMINNTNASTQYAESRDLVIGNTTGSHGMTILSQNNSYGRIMWSDTYTAGSGTYEGQILYNHAAETLNFYSNYTNNTAVAMQLGGSNNQLFVGIDKGNTATYGSRSAFFHKSPDNFISLTAGTSGNAGIVFGDSIGNNGANYESYMYHENSTNDLWIRVNEGNDNRYLKIQQNGNVVIGNGDLLVPSGHGISFAASGNLSTSDSELLDDYEEGYWTPTVGGSSSNGTTNYNHQKGSYVKIGSLVFVSFYLSWTSTTASGTFFVRGLPYSQISTYGTNYNITTGSVMFNSFDTQYANGQTLPYISHAVDYMHFYSSYSTSGWSAINNSASVQNGSSLIGGITYRAA